VKKHDAGAAVSELGAEEAVFCGAAGHGRRCQQLVCQCRRSSTPEDESRLGVSGQATTCGVPGVISTLQPGQRYDFVAAAPDTVRTIQRPSRFTADVACPELSGRAGLTCLLGRRAITHSHFCALLTHRAWNPPTSSSFAKERTPPLTPPQHGGARFPHARSTFVWSCSRIEIGRSQRSDDISLRVQP
jgi:hypothetical protein